MRDRQVRAKLMSRTWFYTIRRGEGGKEAIGMSQRSHAVPGRRDSVGEKKLLLKSNGRNVKCKKKLGCAEACRKVQFFAPPKNT
jgi:hypothetical protein